MKKISGLVAVFLSALPDAPDRRVNTGEWLAPQRNTAVVSLRES